MKTLAIIVVAIIVIALVLSLAGVWGGDDQATPRNAETVTVTETGRLVCLPHLDQSGPTTMECAYGLQTASGVYYALDTSGVVGAELDSYSVEDEIQVTGERTERADLATGDRALIYNVAGKIAVSSVELLTPAPNEHVLTGGAVSFTQPPVFALAATAEQLTATSTVPPCEEGFDYCLYYNDTAYSNTNFSSAGLSILEREDLDTASSCLETLPEGYSELEPEVVSGDEYSTSVFTPLQDAAAGSSLEGEQYRLWHNDACYQFETRIGVTAFENYEAGTIEEFTTADRVVLEALLQQILATIRITATGEAVQFPTS